MHTASVGLLAIQHSRNSLSLLLYYFYWTASLLHHAVAAHQIYTRDWLQGDLHPPAWHFCSTIAYFLRQSKSAKFGLDFQCHSSFESPSFQNEGTCWYQSTGLGSAMINLFSLHIWCSLVHFRLGSRSWQLLSTPVKNKRKKLDI